MTTAIADELRHQHRGELLDELREDCWVADLDAPAAVRDELQRLLATQGLEIPWVGLRRRVREEVDLVVRRAWQQLLREAFMAMTTEDDRPGPLSRLAAWARRHAA
jgi:hypothetical protein